MLVKFMDLNPLFVNGQICHAGIDPAACVVIMNSVLFNLAGLVGVSAENTTGIMLARVL